MKPRSVSARRIGVLMLAFGVPGLSLCATMTAQAEPPVGVTPTVIGRATYDAFDLQSELGFAAQAKSPLDIVVRTAGSSHQKYKAPARGRGSKLVFRSSYASDSS